MEVLDPGVGERVVRDDSLDDVLVLEFMVVSQSDHMGSHREVSKSWMVTNEVLGLLLLEVSFEGLATLGEVLGDIGNEVCVLLLVGIEQWNSELGNLLEPIILLVNELVDLQRLERVGGAWVVDRAILSFVGFGKEPGDGV